NMVARPATAPSVQREIFIGWVFPRGVDAVRRHLSISHATSDVESAGSSETLWRDEALVVLLGNDSVTETTSDCARGMKGSDERAQCMVRGQSWRDCRCTALGHLMKHWDETSASRVAATDVAGRAAIHRDRERRPIDLTRLTRIN